MEKKKIGLMGGTFNPIHTGHLLLAEAAREQAGLDEVWFVPSGQSYMKKGKYILEATKRLRLVELAIEDNPWFRASDIEIRRKGYTYTYETLEYLKGQHADTDLYFIIGADCLFSIDSWKEPARLFQCCKILAAVRGTEDELSMAKRCRELADRFNAEISCLSFPYVEISSTDIRKRLAEGKTIRYMVPEKVCLYMEEEQLYTAEKITGEAE